MSADALEELRNRVALLSNKVASVDERVASIEAHANASTTYDVDPRSSECFGGPFQLGEGRHDWKLIREGQVPVGRECRRCEMRQVGRMVLATDGRPIQIAEDSTVWHPDD